MTITSLSYFQRYRLIDVLSDLESGARPKGGVTNVCDEIPSLGGEHIGENGQINYHKMKFVPRAFFKTMKRGLIQTGDILVVKDGATTGKVAFIDKTFPYSDASVNEHIFICRPNPEKILSKYLFFHLGSRIGQRQIAKSFHGSAQGGITLSFAEEYIIDIPPLQVQHDIVASLEQAEALKRQRQEADALNGALLQSVFYEMFGDPVRNEKGWDTKTLYDILSEDPQNGLYKPFSEYGDDGTPIVRIDSFYSGKIGDLRDLKRINCTEKEIAKYQIHEGDVLINRVNSLEYLGKCGLVQKIYENTIYECNMIRLRPNRTLVDPIYLTTFLCTQSVKNQILNRAKKAVNQASINQQDVKAILILVPPLALQQQFARIVEEVERVREKQAESGKEIEALCGGLMQRAFGGELSV
jgi:Restriction endonuclease S subunits